MSVWHQQRDELQGALAERGIQTQVHYPTALHHTGAYSRLREISLARSEQAAATTLSLPLGPHLPDEHVERVVDAVREALLRQ